MTRQDLAVRNRAAACHLSALPILTSVWLPLVLRRSDPEDAFLHHHATGAAIYQGLSLALLLTMWLCRTLPYRLMSEASAGFLLAFLGVIALCLAGMYLMGAMALAFQAWNGDPFWAPGVSSLPGFAPAEE